MPININELKKKIKYRSNYRGTKEMDLLLGSFVDSTLPKLSYNELLDLLNLLEHDDDSLYKFNQGNTGDIKIEKNTVSDLFKEFKIKKK